MKNPHDGVVFLEKKEPHDEQMGEGAAAHEKRAKAGSLEGIKVPDVRWRKVKSL